MNNDIYGKIVGWAVIVGLLVLCALWLAGCSQNAKPYSDPNKDVYALTGEEIDTIFDYKHEELELANKEKALADLRAFRTQMLWAVLGAIVIAAFWSPKIGIPLVASFGFMIGFAQSLMDYSQYIGWASMVLGALMVGYVIWLNHDKWFVTAKALEEVVTGAENFKIVVGKGADEGSVAATVIGEFKATQIESQKSPATTKLVSAIRKELLPNTK